VEVHRVTVTSGNSAKETATFEECIARVLDPANKEELQAAKKRGKERYRAHDSTNASVTVGTSSIAASNVVHASVVDDDDVSVASSVMPANFLDADSAHFALPAYDKGWKAKYRFPISALLVKGTHKTAVLVHLNLGKVTQLRELIFDNHEEADDFRSVIEQELNLEEQRRQAKLNATLGGLKLKSNETVTFLIEIVSAWDILAGDFFTSDPYVVCLFGGKELHRTKYISKT
jgi:hypothetical protein